MPWKSTNPEVEQIRFIERWESEGETFLELCRAFGISRKTGYKRVQRFRAWGWDGLGDLSRAPHRHPNQTRREVVERLIVVRQEHPTWGPKKLVAWLRDRDSETHWPAPSTVGDLLDQAGLVRRAQGTPTDSALEPALYPSGAAQRPVVHRLQGLVSHRQRCAGRPPYRGGCLLPVSPGVPRAAPAPRPSSAPGSGESLPGVRSPVGHPHRQRPAFCQRRLGRTVVPGGVVDQAGNPARAHPAGASGTERAVGTVAPDVEGGDSPSAPTYVAETAACLPGLSCQLQPRATP